MINDLLKALEEVEELDFDIRRLQTQRDIRSMDARRLAQDLIEGESDSPEPLGAARSGRSVGRKPSPYIGNRPVPFVLGENQFNPVSWKEVLVSVCEWLSEEQPDEFSRVLELRGTSRQYFSRERTEVDQPAEISGTGIYAHTKLNAKQVVDRVHELLKFFRYDGDIFRWGTR